MSFFFFINPKLHIRGGVNAVKYSVGEKAKKILCKRKERTEELQKEINELVGVHNQYKKGNADLKNYAQSILAKIVEMDEEEDVFLLMMSGLCD